MAMAHYDTIGERPFEGVETPARRRGPRRHSAWRHAPLEWRSLRASSLEPIDQLVDICSRRGEWDALSGLLWLVDAATLLRRPPRSNGRGPRPGPRRWDRAMRSGRRGGARRRRCSRKPSGEHDRRRHGPRRVRRQHRQPRAGRAGSAAPALGPARSLVPRARRSRQRRLPQPGATRVCALRWRSMASRRSTRWCVTREATEAALADVSVTVPVPARMVFEYPLEPTARIEDGSKTITFEPPAERLSGERIHQWLGARAGSDLHRITRQQFFLRRLLERGFAVRCACSPIPAGCAARIRWRSKIWPGSMPAGRWRRSTGSSRRRGSREWSWCGE